MTADPAPPPGIDPTKPSIARGYDYLLGHLLGGKDNYPVDREAGEQIRATMPGIIETAHAVRGFLVRAAHYLAGEVGSALLTSTPEGVTDYIDGLELLEPGLVSVSLWRPEPTRIGSTAEVYEFCGVGRKPLI